MIHSVFHENCKTSNYIWILVNAKNLLSRSCCVVAAPDLGFPHRQSGFDFRLHLWI